MCKRFINWDDYDYNYTFVKNELHDYNDNYLTKLKIIDYNYLF